MSYMNEQPQAEPKKSNTTTIIVIVVAVLLCCCCSIVGLYFGYDYLGDPLGIYGLLPRAVSLF